ncbi:hypothetical protein, partial [Ideonella sp.]|uniref:hypothetical protein n=1 Tax=Ideonella sp. TaxID=1929293 RepID=UPI003BB4E812
TFKKIKHKLLLKGGSFDLDSSTSAFPGFSSPSSGLKWRDPHTNSDLVSYVRVLSASAGELS